MWQVEAVLLCRPLLTGAQLGQVLRQHPALEKFTLSTCPRVSDEALELLPANSLKQLTLVGCDVISGRPLRQLSKLETLEFSSCAAINEQAIQVRAEAMPRTPVQGRLQKLASLGPAVPASCWKGRMTASHKIHSHNSE